MSVALICRITFHCADFKPPLNTLFTLEVEHHNPELARSVTQDTLAQQEHHSLRSGSRGTRVTCLPANVCSLSLDMVVMRPASITCCHHSSVTCIHHLIGRHRICMRLEFCRSGCLLGFAVSIRVPSILL